jgi:Zn-dependent protease with chaperone function
MKCPKCPEKVLEPRFTRQGVEVDICLGCEGVWLDKGEIFYFTKRPEEISIVLKEAEGKAIPTQYLSPRTGGPMVELPLFGGELRVDLCKGSGGLWFDGGELKKLLKMDPKRLRIELDKGLSKEGEKPDREVDFKRRMRLEKIAAGLTPLPSLALRSTVTLVGLWAILVFVLIVLCELGVMTPGFAVGLAIAIALIQFLASPFIMDLTLRWLYSFSWVDKSQLPIRLSQFTESVCKDKRMRFPRFGIIHDGAPQAFTYGHHPNNARIVISEGLIDILEPEELNAVVAHEIGHAKHWDMLLMTLAQLVPLILYFIYRTSIHAARGSGRDRGKGGALMVAIGAYILYIISQYIVLWFSRTREYHADRFSGEVTGDPSLLASALVKIAYGLAGREKRAPQKEPVRRSAALESIRALGIFDQRAASTLAIASYPGTATATTEVSKEGLIGAMKWDLWNPWAKYYELHSTHPLVANRLNYLSEQAVAKGKEPFIVFDRRKPESYWDEFFVDLFIGWLPFLVLAVGFVCFLAFQKAFIIGLGLVGVGLAYMLKIRFCYNTRAFPEMNISGLLRKVKVSAIRPVPCTLKGTIIGKGVPGLIWSEDFVMRDDTGIIFLDYRQPLRILDWLFGLLRAAEYQNQDVCVKGWYRRSPVPYVELWELTPEGAKGVKCYTYKAKRILGIVLVILGVILCFA